MTNGQINFVHDLVQMAKAFEELPQVQAQLEAANHRTSELSEVVQRLELRIIDLKTEVDAAHAAKQKAEAERDHAESMFLETDDRLNAFRRLLSSFQAETDALVKASEPEPQKLPEPEVNEVPTYKGQPLPVEFHGDPSNIDSVSTGPQGSREAVEQSASTDAGQTPQLEQPLTPAGTAPTAEPQSESGVSVPSDPTPATASSFESGSPASTLEAATQSQGESAADPIPAPSETTGTTTPTVDTNASDDIGYHNEPAISGSDWSLWDSWAERMNARYGVNNWPARPNAVAAQ